MDNENIKVIYKLKYVLCYDKHLYAVDRKIIAFLENRYFSTYRSTTSQEAYDPLHQAIRKMGMQTSVRQIVPGQLTDQNYRQTFADFQSKQISDSVLFFLSLCSSYAIICCNDVTDRTVGVAICVSVACLGAIQLVLQGCCFAITKEFEKGISQLNFVGRCAAGDFGFIVDVVIIVTLIYYFSQSILIFV